jgi:hypothetical protein
MTTTTTPKPKRGRPKSGVAMRWQAYCECGWESGCWGGAHRKSAYAELRWHKENGCKLAAPVSPQLY